MGAPPRRLSAWYRLKASGLPEDTAPRWPAQPAKRANAPLRPAQLELAEIPVECGLIEAGLATPEEWRDLIGRQAGFFSFDPGTRQYCIVKVPAPWRDTPGPTWQLVAAMLRNQFRTQEEKPPAPSAQQRLVPE